MADNTPQTAALPEEENVFSLKDFFITCISQWKWFLISVIFFVGVGLLYVMRQQPVYSRSMQVLIQDKDGGGALDVAGAFSSLGLGGSNTNVRNELISLQSPAVMAEVVKRLHLNVNVAKEGVLHPTTLYGTTNPIEVEMAEKTKGSRQFKMRLNPDQTYVIEDCILFLPDGSKQKFSDKTVKGKLGFTPVKTPVGEIYIRPNGKYTGEMTEPLDLIVNLGSVVGATEGYTSMLKVDLVDVDADVIILSINDVNIQRAEDILDMVVEVYNEYWVRDKNRVAIATSKFISDRLDVIMKELGDVDNDIAQYQSEHKIPDLQATGQMYLTQSGNVSQDILEVSNQLAMARFLRDFIANPSNESKVIPVTSGVGQQGLDKIISDYNTMLLNREALEENSSANNPLVRDYTTKLVGLRQSIISSLNTTVGQLQANLQSLEGANKISDERLSSTPTQAKYLGTIKRDQTVKESLYLYLLQKREENDLGQAFNAYNTRIIAPPYGSGTPVAPKKGVMIVMCFIFGILVPAAAMYLVVVCDTRVRSRRDLENMPMPFTGEIPQVGARKHFRRLLQSKSKRQKEIDKPKPIVEEGKRDVPNEAFRVVRSNIDLMLGKDIDHSVLMVTSFNPGSGKSFIAYNLGASFALKRKRVLLIDGDLRHGSLSTYVDSPRRGLTSYLTGKTDSMESIIYPVEGHNGLSVIPIGKRPPNPAELIENGRFGELLEKVKQEYDVVLVDCPPVNIVVDTQLLNKYADATIFVVRAGLFQKSGIKDLINLYTEKKLKRMSVLLNGTESAHSSYYSYGNYQSLEE